MKSLLCAVSVCLLAALAAAAETGLTGNVLPFRTSWVNAKTIGNVTEVHVHEGQKVNEGDALAQLDDEIERANCDITVLQAEDETGVEAARIQLAQAERDLNRAKTISEKGAGTPIELERAQYAYDVSLNAVKSKQLDHDRYVVAVKSRKTAVENCVVRAPFAGLVAVKAIEVGETTAPVDRKLFQIIDISKVYVDVHVETRLIRELGAGDTAAVTSDIFPDRRFAGAVSFISPATDLGGHSIGMKLLVDNPDGVLRPGMKVGVKFAGKGAGAPGPDVSTDSIVELPSAPETKPAETAK